MEKLILFINAFLSYFFVFAIIVVLVVAAVLLGIKLRKSKDVKAVKRENAIALEQLRLRKSEDARVAQAAEAAESLK